MAANASVSASHALRGRRVPGGLRDIPSVGRLDFNTPFRRAAEAICARLSEARALGAESRGDARLKSVSARYVITSRPRDDFWPRCTLRVVLQFGKISPRPYIRPMGVADERKMFLRDWSAHPPDRHARLVGFLSRMGALALGQSTQHRIARPIESRVRPR